MIALFRTVNHALTTGMILKTVYSIKAADLKRKDGAKLTDSGFTVIFSLLGKPVS